MKIAIGRPQHAANWITVALLTLFVAAFGIFADNRVDAQTDEPIDPRLEVVRLPTICNELKSSHWPGRIQAVLTELACQSEQGQVAGLVTIQNNPNVVQNRGSR